MCNCGSKRTELYQKKVNRQIRTKPSVLSKISGDVNFRYKGNTSLTAVGKVTGQHYLFQRTGEIIIVDYRDANAMTAIPSLEKIIFLSE